MTHAAVKRCGDSCAIALAAQLQPQGQGRCSMSCLAMAAGMLPSSPWSAFLTCCPASLSRQLSEENANLQEYVEKEVEEKKKLSRTNEELLWKLQEGDAVSPVKLPPAPSTPFYRCSSGNSSPAKVRTLRRWVGSCVPKVPCLLCSSNLQLVTIQGSTTINRRPGFMAASMFSSCIALH